MEGGNYKVIKARPSDITKGVLDRIEKIFNDGFGKEKLKRTFSRARFINSWYIFFQLPNTVMFLLLNEKGKVCGILGGILVQDTVTDHLIATELAWRVKNIGKGGGKLLYEEFEKWAIENGATRIVLGGESGEYESRVKQFYKDRGFEITGFIATKTLKE